jgi:acyl-CoA thioester hydrolase
LTKYAGAKLGFKGVLMKYTNEIRVYYADTDAYKVAWHGAYLRWLEAARVELCNKIGLDLDRMHESGDVLPVVEINIKYKVSAKLDDILVIETEFAECGPLRMKFIQKIRNKKTGTENVYAEITCVAVNTQTGKMYRKIPDYLTGAFETAKV